MLKLNLIRKRMETLPPILPTEPTFQEDHISSKLTTEMPSLEKFQTDGKETLSTPPIPRLLVQRKDQMKLTQ